MSDQIFKPGDLAQHIHFQSPKLFIVKILEDGTIRCRYTSNHRSDYATSEMTFHVHDFEPFELKPYQEEQGSVAFGFL